jgi:antitoxin component of RelBE/YafQ-DinJ toxin-antitoxin module
MRKEYDFSKGIKNPYIKRLKKQITIRLDHSTIEYFKALAEETDISYQNLMNFYLRECASERRKPLTRWVKQAEQEARLDARSRSRKSA